MEGRSWFVASGCTRHSNADEVPELVRVGGGGTCTSPAVDGSTISTTSVVQVDEGSSRLVLDHIGRLERVRDDLPLLIGISSTLVADDWSAALRLASGKIQEGAAVDVLEGEHVVISDLRSNPELGRDPGVSESANRVALNLGAVHAGASGKVHDGTSTNVLNEVNTSLNRNGHLL